ncbi:MAG: sugar transferase [Flavobacteriia bacterium]|nr:sugar transferase [Flavobacteriia bacterium]
MKRIFDIILSLIVLILFFPIGLILSIFIILESKGGVFFIQKRVGKNEREFGMFKFRSMKINSEEKGQLTIGEKDKRITKIGFFIRKYKLDEFPQFINVLKGDMSIVGPRPEVKKYTQYYNEEQKKVLSVKPGITDLASIQYYDENALLGKSNNPEQTYIEEIMPNKIKINLKYCENANILTDFKVLTLTFFRILGLKLISKN